MIITDKTKKPESTWIEEVPFHWKESKNKYVFKLRKAVVGEDWKKYTLLSLSKRGVVPRDIESGKGKFPESFDTYQVVMESDLVFCLYDVEETPRAVGFSEIEGMITGSYDVLEVIDGEPKFFYYYYLTIDDFKGFKPLYTGMRNVVRPENFNNLKIYLPPLPEQQQIVTY
jgi:type I restriction enzyme S subunit